jgi:hypothetical protein
MNLSNWTIFDKAGSQLNWFADSYINLSFTSPTGINAVGYIMTDASYLASSIEITNSGYKYGIDDTSIAYSYTFDPSGQTVILNPTNDISIGFNDVSIFYPDASVTKGVESITLLTNDLSANTFVYPSVVYSGAVFLEPVSQGIIETEHLYIFEQLDSLYIRPMDTSVGSVKIQMYGDDDEIKLFTINQEEQTVDWTDTLYYDLTTYAENTPLSLNIGFKAEDEGIYERKLRIYNTVAGVDHLMAEILVNAESIGEDERHRTLLGNFGLPDPKDFPKLFKETDINEDLPDFEVMNSKSKQMILEHNEIMPYIGTYKALINAVKWLGYEDIYIREWFKNVKQDTKLSLIVPYNAADRTTTLLKFSADERKTLKKLNQLSLNYCLTRDTGAVDAWGTPETENCYEYSIDEVYMKLLSLKDWLEKNIIGVNARIIDITGEGIYYERYINLIYATQNHGFDYSDSQTITPYSTPDNCELSIGDASIGLTLLEMTRTTIKDLDHKFSDFVDYTWNSSDGTTTHLDSSLYIQDACIYLEMGPPISYPFAGIKDIQWKASLLKSSGTIPETHVSNPLWIYDEDIKFYNIFDTSTIFHDSSVNIDMRIEKAYIRDASNPNWEDSSLYSIYPNNFINLSPGASIYLVADVSYAITFGNGTLVDASRSYSFGIGLDPSYFYLDTSSFVTADTSVIIQSSVYLNWILESSLGAKWYFDDMVNLNEGAGAKLQYAYDTNYGVPLFTIKNFNTLDASGNLKSFTTNKLYNLEIIDGRIILDASISADPSTGINASTYLTPTYYIDYKYYDKQYISISMEYFSPRMPMYVVDPSIYYWADPSGWSGDVSSLVIDNSVYNMHVHHTGDYTVNAYTWDGYNVLYSGQANKNHEVWTKYPTIYSLIDSSDNLSRVDCASTFISISDVSSLVTNNKYPIFDRTFKHKGLKVKYKDKDAYVEVPNMTYFQHAVDASNYNRFFNATEKAIGISGSTISMDTSQYQTFNDGDDIRLVLFDKGQYLGIDDASSNIVSGAVTGNLVMDQIPSHFIVDTSHDIYLLNETYRLTQNPSNLYDTSTFIIDISGFTFSNNQLVNIISFDACTGKEYGASYRLIKSPDGSSHTFDKLFPKFIIDAPNRYTNYAKYAFSSPVNFIIDSSSSIKDVSSNINIYSNDYTCNFLDDTFVVMNLDYNQETAIDNWYDTSLNLVNSSFYYYDKEINVDISTLVILRAEYDSTYMLNQKNIWTIENAKTGELVMRVHNKDIPYVFGIDTEYNISVETYDYYGNLVRTR